MPHTTRYTTCNLRHNTLHRDTTHNQRCYKQTGQHTQSGMAHTTKDTTHIMILHGNLKNNGIIRDMTHNQRHSIETACTITETFQYLYNYHSYSCTNKFITGFIKVRQLNSYLSKENNFTHVIKASVENMMKTLKNGTGKTNTHW